MKEGEAKKTALVVLYNHNYEANIPRIKEIYQDRFSQLVQLMPFYYGDDPGVISVFGNSYYFQSFIAQAKHRLMQLDCDYFLIIGDDLLLNPKFNESNTAELLSLKTDRDFYFDDFLDVSQPLCPRGTREAHSFTPNLPGLDQSAVRNLYTYEEAFRVLNSKGYMETTDLRRVKLDSPKFARPLLCNLKRNLTILRRKMGALKYMLKYRFGNKKASYPVVCGYSDIIVVPKNKLLGWCSYLEIFASWNMFVELAIPTSLLLMNDANILTSKNIQFKTGNVCFPDSPDHYRNISSVIDRLCEDTRQRISALGDFFPEEYLYLHPVKLSQFN